jgi:two-component system, OmpR family, sensor histidine kinase KdpD
LQKFVANLLKMAAITSGSLKLKREPYLVQEIIGAALSRVKELKGDRSIATAINGELPIIELDGGLIEQVMINLLENAIAHTSPEGTVSIFAERDADAIRIRVSDDGPGLEPGTEELIFGQSHLVDGPRPDQRGTESTGLGLVICRAIIQAHGGMIYAKNNPGVAGQSNGSSFIFTLPTNRTSS